MQGVQIITSADDAWGGFASEYVAALRDEYSKVAIVTWGLESGDKVPRVSLSVHSFSFFFIFLSYSGYRFCKKELIVYRNKILNEQLTLHTLYQA